MHICDDQRGPPSPQTSWGVVAQSPLFCATSPCPPAHDARWPFSPAFIPGLGFAWTTRAFQPYQDPNYQVTEEFPLEGVSCEVLASRCAVMIMARHVHRAKFIKTSTDSSANPRGSLQAVAMSSPWVEQPASRQTISQGRLHNNTSPLVKQSPELWFSRAVRALILKNHRSTSPKLSASCHLWLLQHLHWRCTPTPTQSCTTHDCCQSVCQA